MPRGREHGEPAAEPAAAARERPVGLALMTLGIVFGDIGTSPLYAFRESFLGHGAPLPATPVNVLGVLSLIFWALIVVISIKYLLLVMRADNRGEGGIIALVSLLGPRAAPPRSLRAALVGLGLFGAALLYGDGTITPAISVLSAIEGLKVATPAFERFVVPLTVVVLVGLFAAAAPRHGGDRQGLRPGDAGLVRGPGAARHRRHPARAGRARRARSAPRLCASSGPRA